MKRRLALGVFLFAAWLTPAAQNPPVIISVDVQSNRHAISPLIYGVNLFEDPNLTSILQDLNCPLNRYGGNRASTYNWNLNSDNRGNDYFFESISDDFQTPAGRTDNFISLTKNAIAEPMVTVPMLDWIAKAGITQPFLCSYPKGVFPNQFAFDPFNTDCGDGLMLDGKTKIDGADPTVAFVANSLATQTSFVQEITGKFMTAAQGGLKFYILDNEHDLWWGTHHDVVPNNPNYTDDRDRMFNYAAMIKAQDPNALVVGPEMSGWLGYIFSPADFQYGETNGYGNIAGFPDRVAMGGSDYAPWLLGQFHQYDTNNGKRILDYFTVHYYPQGGDITTNTRSLWDPAFVDPSYINTQIMLIPRMKQWVATNYPGTKIGITEYNWGTISNEALTDNMGYAVAEADVLGIFGREGLDLATRFNAPPPNLPTYNAMKMYRNYDGMKSTFGDVSTQATVPNPDTVAAFAAQRTADGKVTILLLSKYAADNTVATVNVANFAAGDTAQVWQLSGAGTSIQHLADAAVNNASVSVTLPPQSVTLLVMMPAPAAGGADVTGDFNGDGKADILWRHSSTGQDAVWLMSGATVGNTQLLWTVSDLNWRIAGIGDFNGDGKADILWHNSSTGQNAVYLMNGATVTDAEFLWTVSDLNWQIAGVGDFNGDGKADILWRHSGTGQNAVWLMNGATVSSGQFLWTVNDLNWQIAGIGDFNGDGKADILWHNSSTGQNAVYLMNGATVTDAEFLWTVSDLNWRIVGVGDFNGDGKADILWRHSGTGQDAVWLMNGPTIVSGQFLTTVSDLNWQIAGVGDFNADGKADILWRNASTGQNAVWLMNGSNILSAQFLSTVSDQNWKVVP